MNKLNVVIAAKYFGCKFIYSGSIGIVRTMGGIDWTHNLIDYPKTDTFNTDKCQLILKPLSEISDEDADELIDLMFKADYGILEVDDVMEWLKEVFSGNCAMTADYVSGNQIQILVDFLRSRSYDMDGLIEQGIAIIK